MSRQDDIKNLIYKHSRRLQKLKEKAASQGSSVDVNVLIEIEDIEAKLEELRTELKELEAELEDKPQAGHSSNGAGEKPPINEFPDNPYVQRNAIKDARHFFGRKQETREALRWLAEGQAVSIVGPRRIGKSSLLLHLQRSIQEIKLDPHFKPLIVFLDGQLKFEINQSDMYHWIWNVIANEAGSVPGLPAVVKSSDEFEVAVAALYNAGFRLTLLLDEFEDMARNPKLNAGFFSDLRGLNTAYSVSYVTSSTKPLADLHYSDNSVFSSPFFNFFHQQRLGFLTPEDGQDLIQTPVRDICFPGASEPGFTTDEVEFLLETAGYHPAFLQIACYYLFEHKSTGRKWDAQSREEVRWKYKDQVTFLFRHAYDQLTEDEKKALRLICRDQGDKVHSQRLWKELGHHCLIYNKKSFSSVFKEFISEEIIMADG